MSASFEFSEPTKVTVGTVGEPGQRTFYLQAREADRLMTLKVEKQQVAALAELLTELLSDLPVPEDPPTGQHLELEEPVLAEWAVGTLQLAYDASADRVVLIAEEIGAPSEEGGDPLGDDAPPAGAVARLAVTRDQALGLVRRGQELVSSGRASCPLCGYPMDPAGHSCPKTNGHRSPGV